MTFNHGVEGSSPSALTKEIKDLSDIQEFHPEALCGHCVGKSIAADAAFVLAESPKTPDGIKMNNRSQS